MKTALCVTPLAKVIPVLENCDYIGVDAGALRILDASLPLTMAVGDFDSMNESDYKRIENICPIEKHPIMKDETDSELAARMCFAQGYDEVILYGGLGGRIDHTLLNIRLLSAKFPKLILQDELQRVSLLQVGKYVLDDSYKNISFLPMVQTEISLTGFLYPLNHRIVEITDTYTTSNSLVEKEGIVEIHKGEMLCLQTNIK